jgi:transposase
MASFQFRTVKGHKYLHIVESRRVNGKPRPVPIAYLGKADDILKRLQGLEKSFSVKSFSHGTVAAMLKFGGNRLDIPAILNKYIDAPREYMAAKPIRNNLTAGITFLLAAIGRACLPTSKEGWNTWANETSLPYLLKSNFNKVDSQHFWDLMDAMPVENIDKAEAEIMRTVFEVFDLKTDTLFYDTSNFFTYINTTNERADIAQRGKNKQKRTDLRQVGLALVVSKQDFIPIFHHTYQGNLNDVSVFGEVILKIRQRILDLKLDPTAHTFVFDRGNNSNANLKILAEHHLHYVGALTPYHHKDLIEMAHERYQTIQIKDQDLEVARIRTHIWGEERTVVIFISDKMKAGQIRGVYQALEKVEKELHKLMESLANPRGKKRTREQLEMKIASLIKGQYLAGLIDWCLTETKEGKWVLNHNLQMDKLRELEDRLGFRIVMTNRHQWSTQEIILAYYGQATIERSFRHLKNPYHLAIKPQFHWTDQKIKIHFFICVIGYLLVTLIWRELRLKIKYKHSIDTLLDTMNNVRLATLVELTGKQGKPKPVFQLEKMNREETKILKALELLDYHLERPKIQGVGVYTKS